MPPHHQQSLATQERSLSHSAQSILGDFDPDTVVSDWSDIVDIITTREAKSNLLTPEATKESTKMGLRLRSDSAIDAALQERAQPQISEAASKVLETYELVEFILLHVPNSTVLRLQRTNTTFNHVVNRSVELQQKLFFQPKPPRKDGKPEDIIWNPMLTHPSVDEVIAFSLDQAKYMLRIDKPHDVVTVLQECNIDRTRETSQGIIGKCFSVPTSYIKHGQEESWHRMLLCQGIARTAKLILGFCCVQPIPSCAGATMGALWNRSKSEICRHLLVTTKYEAALKHWAKTEFRGSKKASMAWYGRPRVESCIKDRRISNDMYTEAAKKSREKNGEWADSFYHDESDS